MNRRELLKRTAALGVAAGIPSLLAGKLFAGTDGVQAKSAIGKTVALIVKNNDHYGQRRDLLRRHGRLIARSSNGDQSTHRSTVP
jgi:hypothetical protein